MCKMVKGAKGLFNNFSQLLISILDLGIDKTLYMFFLSHEEDYCWTLVRELTEEVMKLIEVLKRYYVQIMSIDNTWEKKEGHF